MASPTGGTKAGRIVVLGPRGIIGSAVVQRLTQAGEHFVALSSEDLDLLSRNAVDDLASTLNPNDSLLMISGLTDQKGEPTTTLFNNLSMARTVCEAVARSPCALLAYISSDAVYRYSSEIVTENTAAAPDRLYGTMHLMREQMLETCLGDIPLSILRCSAAITPTDTHNAYGPHRFARQAIGGDPIRIFGDGCETRDYISIDDIAELTYRVLRDQRTGILNLATGKSRSFSEVADTIAEFLDYNVETEILERTVPVTHRQFDVTRVTEWFPDFEFTPFTQSMAALCRALQSL